MKILDNVQRRAVRFIAGLKGRECISEDRDLRVRGFRVDGKKTSRMALMLKILSKEIPSALVDNFSRFYRVKCTNMR